MDAAGGLKSIVGELRSFPPTAVRSHHLTHRAVYRPFGGIVGLPARFLSKRRFFWRNGVE